MEERQETIRPLLVDRRSALVPDMANTSCIRPGGPGTLFVASWKVFVKDTTFVIFPVGRHSREVRAEWCLQEPFDLSCKHGGLWPPSPHDGTEAIRDGAEPDENWFLQHRI